MSTCNHMLDIRPWMAKLNKVCFSELAIMISYPTSVIRMIKLVLLFYQKQKRNLVDLAGFILQEQPGRMAS